MRPRQRIIILGLLGIVLSVAVWLSVRNDAGNLTSFRPTESGVAMGSGKAGPAPEGASAPEIPLQTQPFIEPKQSGEPDPAWTLELLDFDEKPVGHASVGVAPTREDFKIGEEFPCGVTALDGRYVLKQLPETPSVLVICASNRLPEVVPLERAHKLQRVKLSGQPSLAGVIRVDGQVARDPVTLTIRGFRSLLLNEAPAVRHFCAAASRNEGEIVISSEAEGRFAVFGIPALEDVEVSVSDRYELVFADSLRHSMSARTPKQDLVIDLRERRAVIGRPISRDTSLQALLTFLQVFVVIESRDGSVREANVGCRVQETFRIPVTEPEIVKVSLEIRDFAKNETVLRRVREGNIERVLDFGDLVFPEVSSKLTVLVLDVADRPVAGARVRIEARCAPPTDEAGRTSLDPPAAAKLVYGSAFGFEQASALIERPGAEVVLRLKRSSIFSVVLQRPDSITKFDGLRAVLRFSKRIPNDAPELWPGFSDVRGLANGGLSQGPNDHEILYNVPESGRLQLSGFGDGTEFEFLVTDRFEHLLLKEIVRLNSAEKLELVRMLPRAPRSIRGRVIDESGKPISGAQMSVGSTIYPSWVLSDASGSFVIDPVYAEPWTLSAKATGFVARNIQEASYQDATVVLAKARSLDIEVRDLQGNPVESEVFIEFPDGRRYGTLRTSVGRFRGEGLPKTEGRFVVVFGKKKSKEVLWPDQTEALLLVNP